MSLGKEKVKAKDELSVVLYDEHGNVKQVSRPRKTKKEKAISFLKKVLENW